jgi:small GTP-binding protein
MSSKLNEIKLVLVGDTNVGKTSLVSRYLYNKFAPSSATIAAQFMIKVVTFAGQNYKLQIWDTAGQERFRAMAPLYYRNADVAIIVSDVQQRNFHTSITFWLEQLQKASTDDLVIAVCINKSDVAEEEWTISRKDLTDLVQNSNANGCDVYVTSAKENKGVVAMFKASIEKKLEKKLLLRKHQEQQRAAGRTRRRNNRAEYVENNPRGVSGGPASVQLENKKEPREPSCC